MDEHKEILQELKIDWDTCLQENFNPLTLSLKLLSNTSMIKEFGETDHRLESVMDKMIKANFTGFSESFTYFQQLYELNKQIIDKSKEIEECLDAFTSLQSGDSSLALVNDQQSEESTIYMICAKITEAKNLYKEFLVVNDPQRKALLMHRCLAILQDEKYSRITGVSEFSKKVVKAHHAFCSEIYDFILDFVIENRCEYAQFIHIVMKLDSMAQCSQYLQKNFFERVMQALKDITTELVSKEMFTLDDICKQAMNIIELCIDNMQFLIKKFSEVKTGNKEEQKSKCGFVCDIQETLKIFKKVLEKFIEMYSFEFEPSNVFDVHFVYDHFEYEKTFDKNSSVYRRLTASQGANNYRGICNLITCTSSETARKLLKFTKNEYLKMFLHGIVKKNQNASFDERTKRYDAFFNEYNIEKSTKLVDLVEEMLNDCLSLEDTAYFKNYLNAKIFTNLVIEHSKLFQSEISRTSHYKLFIESVKAQKQKTNFQIDDLIVIVADLEKLLLTQRPNRASLFFNTSKYKEACEIINSLHRISKMIETDEMKFLMRFYQQSLNRQAVLDFFFFYDLFYRQGNFHYYLKICCDVLETIQTFKLPAFEDLEKCFNYYNKMNVAFIKCKNRVELEEMVKYLQILNEVSGSVIDISKTLDFFNGVLSNKDSDKQMRILKLKIG